jgi:acetyl esterase/lipase
MNIKKLIISGDSAGGNLAFGVVNKVFSQFNEI